MGEIAGTTTLVGLIGDPVAESLSPRMQNAAFAARGLDWAYVPLRVEHASLDVAVAALVAFGFAGANVTTPHKAAVIPFCDELDETAERGASVNTLVVGNGRVLGASTDAEALGISRQWTNHLTKTVVDKEVRNRAAALHRKLGC